MTESAAPRQRAMKKLAIGLIADVGLPIIAYYGLRFFGFDEYLSLLAGSVVAGVRTLYVAVRARKLDGFAVFMLATFVFGLAMTFVTGDARFLLVKDSFGTSLVGAIFLVTSFFGKPMVYYGARRFAAGTPEKVAEMDRRYATEPRFRQTFRTMSLVWGCTLLVEAAVRIPLVYLLPVDVMAGLSQMTGIAVIGLLILWTMRYVRRRRREGMFATTPAPVLVK
ncbi:VC0807 family protein [Fodinicola acaciae]|uniref:VC0807 family protein n=1 Tax=Fodinicola acaciae TaxID=2681555 RepID=UPI001C9E7CEE|nr:VC0807 family protein [Fodinicola acaciae]